jgi:hypothetical protein
MCIRDRVYTFISSNNIAQLGVILYWQILSDP